MAQKKRKYKIVFGKSDPVIKIALLSVIILSTVALIAIGCAIDRSEADLDAKTKEGQDLQNSKDATVDAIEDQKNGNDVPDGYVDPDTIIIVPKS